MFCLYTPAFTTIMPLQVLSVWSDSWIHASCASSVSPQWDLLCVRDRRWDASSVADLRTCDYDLCSSLRRRPDAAGIQLPGYSAALGTEPHLTRVLLYYSHWHESNFRLRALSAYHVLLLASPTVWAASDGSVINLWRVSHRPSAGLSCW